MPVMMLWILALAVSFDGFGVGVTYGLRRIRIPLLSILIIACCSAAVFYTAMQLGQSLSYFLSPWVSNVIGAVILIGIGLWATIQTLLQKNDESEQKNDEPKQKIIHIEIKRLGLVIEILRTPSKADLDRSGIISSNEAVWLGVALSLDAFGAGIGAALVGLPPILTSLVIGLSCGICIMLGLKTGYIFAHSSWIQKIAVLPGLLLVCMGIFKLL